MKKIALILGLFAFASCESIKDAVTPEPVAYFKLSYDKRGYVKLTDNSENAEIKQVDWGDGTTSEMNSMQTTANHSYSSDGNYTVTLKAYSKNKNKSDVSSTIAKITNTAGDFKVYIQKQYFPESYAIVYIDGVQVGNLLQFDVRDLGCSSDMKNVFVKELKTGKHTYKVVTMPGSKFTWTNSFEVGNNQCVMRKLI